MPSRPTTSGRSEATVDLNTGRSHSDQENANVMTKNQMT